VTHNSSFKVTVFFESEYLKTVCLREKSFYRKLIGNHGYSVEWYQFDDLESFQGRGIFEIKYVENDKR